MTKILTFDHRLWHRSEFGKIVCRLLLFTKKQSVGETLILLRGRGKSVANPVSCFVFPSSLFRLSLLILFEDFSNFDFWWIFGRHLHPGPGTGRPPGGCADSIFIIKYPKNDNKMTLFLWPKIFIFIPLCLRPKMRHLPPPPPIKDTNVPIFGHRTQGEIVTIPRHNFCATRWSYNEYRNDTS